MINKDIYIGDTPEQLGCITAADAIMIDGKVITREDVRRLQSERDSLAATVEALRKDKSGLLAYVNDAERWFNRHDPNGYVSPKREAAQQHLRDVRAEAIIQASNHLLFALGEPTDAVIALDKYTERVRDGE